MTFTNKETVWLVAHDISTGRTRTMKFDTLAELRKAVRFGLYRFERGTVSDAMGNVTHHIKLGGSRLFKGEAK